MEDKNMIDQYKNLLDITRELVMLSSISGKLAWDLHTQLPKNGVPFRNLQFTFLEEKISDIYNSPRTRTMITSLEKNLDKYDPYQQRNILVFKRVFNRKTAIPKDLILANKKQEGISFAAWQESKQTNNFKLFQPELEKNLENKRKIASYIDENALPFDVFLNQFEAGYTSAKIRPLFDSVKTKVLKILKQVQTSGVMDKIPVIDKRMDRITQERLISDIATYIGFNLNSGRIDHGEHPMTYNSVTGDVRFTVNFNEQNYFGSLFAGLHEGGHAIHGQNMPEERFFHPIRSFGGSAGISESQSRFYENIVGRSLPFWKGYKSNFEKITGRSINIEEFYRAINEVKLSKIRIQADELTYVMHIILRFEIETELLNGTIQVSELPSIWNEKIDQMFGLKVKNDAEGVLQDIHWATVFYGYFPTYALGNMYNAQMYNSLQKDLDFATLLEQRELSKITNWLKEHVHIHTGMYDPEEFLVKVTGEKLNPDYFTNYLADKFLKSL